MATGNVARVQDDAQHALHRRRRAESFSSFKLFGIEKLFGSFAKFRASASTAKSSESESETLKGAIEVILREVEAKSSETEEEEENDQDQKEKKKDIHCFSMNG